MKAVGEVESRGETHWQNGQVPILFEAHWFGKLTGYKFNASHPSLSTTSWKEARRHYLGGPAEYGRLEEARLLDRDAANQSASWGAFQVMGFNWKKLGYASVQAFVDSVQSAGGQLDAFVRYVEAHPQLADAIRRQDWEAFAGGYNGTGAIHAYAPKMAAAFARHSA